MPARPVRIWGAKMTWRDVLGQARLSLARATFEAHLANSSQVDETDGEWTIALHSQANIDWVRLRLKATLETIALAVTGRQVTLRFVVSQMAIPTPPAVPAGSQLLFGGFTPPASDFTQVPNQFFTELLPVAPPTATAFTLAVAHHSLLIVSWRPLRRAEWWTASYAQIALACGMSRSAVRGAVAWSCNCGFVVREAASGQSWRYRLRYENDPPTLFEGVDNALETVDNLSQKLWITS